MLSLFLIPNVFAQDQQQQQQTTPETSRTLDNCYSEITSLLMLATMFTTQITAVDLLDPEVQKYFQDQCKFYYKKTGEWISPTNDHDLVELYEDELLETIPVPKKLKKLFSQQTGQ